MQQPNLPPLPPSREVQTIPVMRALARASRILAELKGEAKTIPNETILINTLGLQEAKDSSAIENIVTTHDELFLANAGLEPGSQAAKEVQNYAASLLHGYKLVKTHGLLTVNNIIDAHAILEPNRQGVRRIPGTVLKNALGEVMYTPPQSFDEITALLDNLNRYINDPDMHDVDPLIKMAIVHYQFESIHPFYDGNGRIGRIINVLYLVQQSLLDIPVLYLSKYIIQQKPDYYRLLQQTGQTGDFEAWVLWMLRGVEETALATIVQIKEINVLMADFSEKVRAAYPNMYSKDLIESLFKQPYTKIEFLMRDLSIIRQTASSYLKNLTEIGLLRREQPGRSAYFINDRLKEVFMK